LLVLDIATKSKQYSPIELAMQLKSYITNYYKALFGPPEEGSFSLDEFKIADIPQVS
jgi:hypothetical protein